MYESFDQGAVAETIENNIRRLIIDENQTNPAHFKAMSALLDELIGTWQKKQLRDVVTFKIPLKIVSTYDLQEFRKYK